MPMAISILLRIGSLVVNNTEKVEHDERQESLAPHLLQEPTLPTFHLHLKNTSTHIASSSSYREYGIHTADIEPDLLL